MPRTTSTSALVGAVPWRRVLTQWAASDTGTWTAVHRCCACSLARGPRRCLHLRPSRTTLRQSAQIHSHVSEQSRDWLQRAAVTGTAAGTGAQQQRQPPQPEQQEAVAGTTAGAVYRYTEAGTATNSSRGDKPPAQRCAKRPQRSHAHARCIFVRGRCVVGSWSVRDRCVVRFVVGSWSGGRHSLLWTVVRRCVLVVRAIRCVLLPCRAFEGLFAEFLARSRDYSLNS